jgi:hypothetical protein
MMASIIGPAGTAMAELLVAVRIWRRRGYGFFLTNTAAAVKFAARPAIFNSFMSGSL